jgi:nicotinamide riboside kinase
MKIGFCGTMSVGKTTLVNTLKNIPEFKDYHFATERSKYLNSLGIPLNTDSTLKGQNIFLAERCAELMNENLITDRTIVDVMAFTKLAKSISYIDGDAFEEYAKRFIREYDYVFYISPEGIAIEDNGVRETDEKYRNEIDLTIRQLLNRYKPWHHVLIGSTEERVKQVLKVCFDIY